jgi:hypothetical protein
MSRAEDEMVTRFRPGDRVRTTVVVKSEFSTRLYPVNTEGTVVECYEDPDSYAVDLAVPDDTFVGGYAYDNLVLPAGHLIKADGP